MSAELAVELYSSRDETGDITFIVESEHIKAHRSVLAALSPKYKAQFYGNQPDQGSVRVAGVSSAAFAEFIKFFYLNGADVTMDNINEVLYLAQQSLFDRLITECKLFLCKSLNEENVFRIYDLARMWDIKMVMDVCICKIGQAYVPHVFTHVDFLGIDLDTLLDILDFDVLNCKEVEVFEGCIKWAQTALIANEVIDAKGKDLRAVLRDAFSKIRFKSMTLHDFVNLYEKYEGFFSTEEYIQITQTISGHQISANNINQTLRRRRPKFEPIRIPDKMTKGRVSLNIVCPMYCITGMAEYNHMSLEELRFEDYCSFGYITIGNPITKLAVNDKSIK